MTEVQSSAGPTAAMTRTKAANAKRIKDHNATINKQIEDLDGEMKELEAK